MRFAGVSGDARGGPGGTGKTRLALQAAADGVGGALRRYSAYRSGRSAKAAAQVSEQK
jgi:hypothetical protein